MSHRYVVGGDESNLRVYRTSVTNGRLLACLSAAFVVVVVLRLTAGSWVAGWFAAITALSAVLVVMLTAKTIRVSGLPSDLRRDVYRESLHLRSSGVAMDELARAVLRAEAEEPGALEEVTELVRTSRNKRRSKHVERIKEMLP